MDLIALEMRHQHWVVVYNRRGESSVDSCTVSELEVHAGRGLPALVGEDEEGSVVTLIFRALHRCACVSIRPQPLERKRR